MYPSRVSPAVIAAALSACALEPESLNSDRIGDRFGSYGITVLPHTGGVRRSSLYSVDGETKTCRTYAVVRFVDDSTPSVATAHADVLAGHSIGTTFKSTGWQSRKITLHIGHLTLDASQHAIGKLMRLEGVTEFAIHAYQLVLEKESQTVNYATIAEMHHPDYMSLPEVKSLYGDGVETRLSDDEIRDLSDLILDSDQGRLSA